MKASQTIKKLRKELLLEQSELAQLLNVSPSTISHWEAGIRFPRLPAIKQVIDLAKRNKVKLTIEDFE